MHLKVLEKVLFRPERLFEGPDTISNSSLPRFCGSLGSHVHNCVQLIECLSKASLVLQLSSKLLEPSFEHMEKAQKNWTLQHTPAACLKF
jgi:hypothetical protein